MPLPAKPPTPSTRQAHIPFLLTLTALSFCIHGYHPYAEDGGMYVTGIKLFLKPTLYPHDTAFVTVRRAYSLYDPILGMAVRGTHLSLDVVLLAAQLCCIFLTLLATARLAARCFRTPRAPLFAAALMAVALALPVAGTSLFFMEPYLTTRSFTTPLSLLAIYFFLNEDSHMSQAVSVAAGTVLLLCAAIFHLAMAFYTAAFILLLFTFRIRTCRSRVLTQSTLIAAALMACLALQIHAPKETPVALIAAHTRTYWYLSQWQWYEWLGLICPLITFALMLRYGHAALTPTGRTLLHASLVAGPVGCLLSLSFARYNQHTMAVARLQPLRVYHNLYGVLIMLLGGLLACWSDRLPPRRRWLLLLPTAAVGAAMLFAQRASFPASRHVEWPGQPPVNPYAQAFFWARLHTPPDALFAIDSHYMTREGEDAQNFRAIAERSMLSDYSKDGGSATIRPALAEAWLTGSTATQGLDRLSPEARDARLRPLHVTWMVLQSSATAPRPCPYDNGTVKVCPLD